MGVILRVQGIKDYRIRVKCFRIMKKLNEALILHYDLE